MNEPIMMPPVAPVVRLRDRLRAALPDLAIPTLMYAVYIGVLVWIAPQTTHVPGEFWQLLPAEALLERPWRSLLSLHAQPPLYNVLYAGVLHLEQATGWAAARIAMVLMTGFGWLACVAWFRVAAALMGSRRWAIALIALLLTHPGFAYYQRIFFYPQMLLALHGVAALVWLRFAMWPTTGRLLAAVAAVAVIVYLRAMWHPVYVMVPLGLVAWHLHRQGAPWVGGALRMAGRGLLFFLALIAPWALKNQVLFNTTSFTTWTGLNIRNLNTSVNPLWDFSETGEYPGEVIADYYSAWQLRVLSGEPALTQLFKGDPDDPATREPNMNHLAVPALNRLSLRATIEGYRREPIELPRALAANLMTTSLPATYQMYSMDLKSNVYRYVTDHPYHRWHDQVYYGAWLIPHLGFSYGWGRLGFNLYLALWLPLALVAGVVRLRRIHEPEGLAWAILLGMYAWAFFVVVVIDGAEGARMRWQVEPVYLMLVMQGVRELGRKLISHR